MTRAVSPTGSVQVTWWESALSAVLVCVGGLWQFEAKGVLYFDELINAGLADEGVVQEFSLRPLYRLLNLGAWNVFGGDYESLRLLGFISYGVIAWVVFRAGLLLGGRTVAWSALLAFCFSETVVVHGVRGMPHLPAGVFVTLALVCLLHSEGALAPGRRRGFAAGAGVLALLAVATHPTVLPFVLALGLWGLGEVFVRRIRSASWRDALDQPGAPLIVSLGLSSLALVVITSLYGRSYVGAILGGIGTVQGETTYAFYHRPWNQYLLTLLDDTVLLAALGLGLAVAGLACGIARRGGGAAPVGAEGRRLALLAWTSCCSITVLSLLAWRFERVFVTYVPILVLTAAALLAYGLRRLTSRPRAGRLLAGGLLIVLALAAGASLAGATTTLAEIRSADWKRFDRFSDVLSSVTEGDEIGYLGDGLRYERARDFVRASGRDLFCLASGVETPPEGLERELVARGLGFVMSDFSDPSDRRGVASWWNHTLSSLELEEVYEHRDFFRLWRVRIRPAEPGFRRALGAIEADTQVAVLGWPEELEPMADYWLSRMLDQYHLRPYRLSLLKSAHAQFNYVPTKEIRWVWITPTSSDLQGSNYWTFRRLMEEAGGRIVAEDPIAPAELWEMP